jgi:hypothetical protein
VVIPSYPPACAAIALKSMSQATRIRHEQDGMAHHHQARLRTALLTGYLGRATARHQVNGDAGKEQHQRHQAPSAQNPNMHERNKTQWQTLTTEEDKTKR